MSTQTPRKQLIKILYSQGIKLLGMSHELIPVKHVG